MTNIHGIDSVLVDSSALIGIFHAEDKLHVRSMGVLDYFEKQKTTLIVPFPIVLESATSLSRRINRPDLSKKLLEDFLLIKQPQLIEEDIPRIVAQLFKEKGSKKNTPFDYYLLALAKRNSVSIIFSFDSFYKKNGLQLAEELLEK